MLKKFTTLKLNANVSPIADIKTVDKLNGVMKLLNLLKIKLSRHKIFKNILTLLSIILKVF